MFRFSKKSKSSGSKSKSTDQRLERAQSDTPSRERVTESIVDIRRLGNKSLQEPAQSFRHTTNNGVRELPQPQDDVEDVFYNMNSMNGIPPVQRMSSRSSTRSSARGTETSTARYTTSSMRSTQSTGLEVLQENEELRQTHNAMSNGSQAPLSGEVRSELSELKEQVQGIKREMMNEMHLTRYDLLKEVTMLKGTILQLVTLLETNGVVNTGANSNAQPTPELTKEDLDALTKPTTTHAPKPSRNTVAKDETVPQLIRSSSRMTQLCPVADTALSTPLTQEQIDRMFPLIDASRDIQTHCRNFENGTRQWVVERFEEWVQGSLGGGQDRVVALVGDGGSGKSTLAGSLCDRFDEHIAAHHFCHFDRKVRSSPRNVLLSLVNQLSKTVPLFKNQLARLNLRYVLEETDVYALASKVLIDPLCAVDEPVTSKVIVIDGLDQCRNHRDNINDLLDFIAAIIPSLPSWVGVFITTKPFAELAKKLPITSVIDFSPKSEEFTRDAGFLLDDILSSFDPTVATEARSVLMKKSGGNLSYLMFTKQALTQPDMEQDDGYIPVEVLHDLPESLSEIYEEIFEDKFGKGRNRMWKKAQPLLELIASAASGPYALITEDQAMSQFSFTKEDLRMVRRSFMDIVSVRGGNYRIESSSLFDWLTATERSGEQFYINTAAGVSILRQLARRQSSSDASSSFSSDNSSNDGQRIAPPASRSRSRRHS